MERGGKKQIQPLLKAALEFSQLQLRRGRGLCCARPAPKAIFAACWPRFPACQLGVCCQVPLSGGGNRIFFAVIYLVCSSAAKEEAGGDVCESCGLFSAFFPQRKVLGVCPGWAERRFVMERGAAEPRSSETRAWGSRFPSTEDLGSLRI